MSRTNVQVQQAEVEPAKPASSFRNQYSSDIQTEIGRAFEVASAIERALRAETPETLEQFLTRAVTVLFERIGEGCMNIVPAADFLSPVHIYSESHKIQIYTKMSDAAHGGKTIGLAMPSLPRSEIPSAHECMRHFGFLPSQGSANATENRALGGLDIRIVVGLACCLLKELPKISAKNEILCWFDHAINEGKFVERRLHSAGDLTDCLKSILLHEPLKCECAIKAGHEERILLFVNRLPSKKVRLFVDCSNLSPKKKSKMREMLKSSGFVWRDSQNPSGPWQDWSGPENPELLIATVQQILEVRGAGFESNGLRIGLHWPPFFN